MIVGFDNMHLEIYKIHTKQVRNNRVIHGAERGFHPEYLKDIV